MHDFVNVLIIGTLCMVALYKLTGTESARVFTLQCFVYLRFTSVMLER